MTVTFDIVHTTEYRYNRPVEFGEHRLMFRPRDSHDLRVLATDLEVHPGIKEIRMMQDVYSNSVALIKPKGPSKELRFTCLFTVEHAGTKELDLPVSPGAAHYPFEYSAEDRIALAHYLAPFYDADDRLMSWVRKFVHAEGRKGRPGSLELLIDMTKTIRDSMAYEVREEEGVQTPGETLELGRGSCRDFATLMIEAVRRIGYAARFVSGYVYSPPLETQEPSGARTVPGATHAWLQVYLPGAGWIAFDPTNNVIGGTDLIRVAFARHAGLASPVSGSWIGTAEDYEGMEVDVQVTRRD